MAKWVVGEYFDTDWNELGFARESLPVVLNLSVLYDEMLRRLISLPARTGESLKDHTERVSQISIFEKQCRKLKAQLIKEKQFNRKIEINSELRAVMVKIENLKVKRCR